MSQKPHRRRLPNEEDPVNDEENNEHLVIDFSGETYSVYENKEIITITKTSKKNKLIVHVNSGQVNVHGDSNKVLMGVQAATLKIKGDNNRVIIDCDNQGTISVEGDENFVFVFDEKSEGTIENCGDNNIIILGETVISPIGKQLDDLLALAADPEDAQS